MFQDFSTTANLARFQFRKIPAGIHFLIPKAIRLPPIPSLLNKLKSPTKIFNVAV